ncbi:MAG: ABC transporter permease [Firmicutes bacterium]|nr:ABC transporter permease [Bacillota bacterium]
MSEGVSIIDNKILHVKKGHKFTEAEKKEVIGFLENAQGDLILSKDEKSNADFRRLSRIDAEGNKESFEDVTEKTQNIKRYDPSEFKLIRSRLPLRHSLKIAGSSLKAKPIRLFFTVLLSVIAFGLFGLADTLGAYNKHNALYESMRDSQIDYASFAKRASWGGDTGLNAEEAATIRQKFPDSDFDELRSLRNLGMHNITYGASLFDFNLPDNQGKFGAYYTHGQWSPSFGGVLELPKDISASATVYRGYSISGRVPAAFDEIMISRHVFNAFKDLSLYVGNDYSYATTDKKAINSDNDLLGEKIRIGDRSGSGLYATVVGIIDTNFPSDRYTKLKEAPDNSSGFDISLMFLSNEILNAFMYGYHGAMFTANGFIEHISQGAESNYLTFRGSGGFSMTRIEQNSSFSFIASDEQLGKDGLSAVFADGRTTNALAEGEALVSLETFLSLMNRWNWVWNFGNLPWGEEDPDYAEKMQQYEAIMQLRNAPYGSDAEFMQAAVQFYFEYNDYGYYDADNNWVWVPFDDIAHVEAYMIEESGFWQWDDGLQDTVWVTGSVEQFLLNNFVGNFDTLEDVYWHILDRDWFPYMYFAAFGPTVEEARDIVRAQAIAALFTDGGISTQARYWGSVGGSGNFTLNIVGIAYDEDFSSFNSSGVVVSGEVYGAIQQMLAGNGDIVAMLTRLPESRAAQMAMIEFSYIATIAPDPWGGQDGSYRFMLMNSVTSGLEEFNYYLEMFAQVFLYVGLGFALFASFLMMNFIMASISFKKRQIGILRAIGAKSGDVFMIFFLEALMIALICFLFAVLGAGLGAFFINGAVRNMLGLLITLLSFSARQIALVLAVSVGVAFIASFLPVYTTARKKPIEAIRKA